MNEIKSNTGKWILWSTVGFGLFYLPLTAASLYGESWFTASTWQITIVCGVLLTPLWGKSIPIKNLLCSCIILAGIVLLEYSHIGTMSLRGNLIAFGLILIAAFSYPLGNRKMMELCPKDFSTTQRVFGMTLCSMPFWIICSIYAVFNSGLPSSSQVLQSFIVALFSGVIATMLFFEATRLVQNNAKQLAVIEATQSGEVVFTLILGLIFLGDPMPSLLGIIGIIIIVAGMIANSLAAGGNKGE